MRANIKAIVVCILVALNLLFSSCGPGQYLGNTETPTLTFTRTPTITPTSTFTQTPTITLTPTITQTATITVTPSPTLPPILSCINNEPFLAKWATTMNKKVFEAFICPGNILIAIFKNEDFPEYMTINTSSRGAIEFYWAVWVDVDADKKTGTQKYGLFPGGAEYELRISHRSVGNRQRVLFSDAFEKHVWKCEERSCGIADSASLFADRENKLIVLRGTIPGINANSLISFNRFYYTVDNNLTYKTDWVTSTSVHNLVQIGQ